MALATDLARRAAVAGGAVLRDRAQTITGIRSKSSVTDFVSDVDIAAGVAIAEILMAEDSSASLVVEEPEVYELVGARPGRLTDDRVWVVDPLDGTTSYLHGFPCYSVSVALLEGGQPTTGAVYAPVLDELHWAEKGAGAFVGDRRLEATLTATVPEALLVTGFPYDRGAPLDRQLAVLGSFLRAPVHGIRRDGSAALDLSHVAAGRCDGFWEFTLQPWDMAAGVLLCREAGARVTDVEGREWDATSTSVVAANPALHESMLRVIAESA